MIGNNQQFNKILKIMREKSALVVNQCLAGFLFQFGNYFISTYWWQKKKMQQTFLVKS